MNLHAQIMQRELFTMLRFHVKPAIFRSALCTVRRVRNIFEPHTHEYVVSYWRYFWKPIASAGGGRKSNLNSDRKCAAGVRRRVINSNRAFKI